ncbi:hypothetical protein GGF39_003245 [Coemansia sp. RSA 1721]|nr:hypothetical protein GGF39_003245 [Coemansia sp. RSA 1721]
MAKMSTAAVLGISLGTILGVAVLYILGCWYMARQAQPRYNKHWAPDQTKKNKKHKKGKKPDVAVHAAEQDVAKQDVDKLDAGKRLEEARDDIQSIGESTVYSEREAM